jgi:hypothetical protein
MAVNAIGYLCEAAWHHADLAVTWGKLWVQHKTSYFYCNRFFDRASPPSILRA